jgi:ATP-dependent DNA helicase PIF1
MRKSHQHNLPFGGIQVIFCGDFFQLPPVPNIDDPLTEKFCFQSPIWKTVFKPENHIELTTIFRQKDPIYKSILSNIRKGIIDDESHTILKQRLHLTPPPDLQITKLFPILKLVEIENQKQFNLIDADIYEYEFYINTKNTLYRDSGTEIPKDILIQCQTALKRNPDIIDYEIKYLLTNSKCVEKIQLKVGAFVMTTVNLNLDKGICNGSQGTILAINEINGTPIPTIKFYNGVIMDIPYYSWQSENYPTISIEQIPLILAWAISIHKSQGATLKYAQMDIGNSIFAEGQVYVALSRVESLDGLYLTAINPDKIKVNTDVLEFYAEF